MKIKLNRWPFALMLLVFMALSIQSTVLRAQSTSFTYQGRMMDNGTNFSGSGQFAFALVTSTNISRQATATANLTGVAVTSYTVTDGGNGYTSAPAVSILGGPGSGRFGATAHAVVSGGVVTGIVADSPGSYSSAPTVVIAPPPPDISYTTYWSNDGTSTNGSEPTNAVNISVSNGLFTVVLGDTTIPNMGAMDTALFTQPNLQLRIWFSDGANSFAALDPAQNLTATPYAAVAQSANSLPGLGVQQNSDGAPNIIEGASANYISSDAVGATVGGGGANSYPISSKGHNSRVIYSNSVTANFGTVGGGRQNTASSGDATVGGGFGNTASGSRATVGGGNDNTASGGGATVGGGFANTASGFGSFVGGGGYDGNDILGNLAGGDASTIGGGYGNSAGGLYATVPGGANNTANGPFSFAAGYQAQALHQGTFVWADSQNAVFSSTTTDQYLIRAQNGVGINTANTSGNALTVNGTIAATAFNTTSDRNAKENFATVNPQIILSKVASLPVSEWNFKADAAGQKHLGPMAQDFHAAFGLNGGDDKHISIVDEGGVALAAIQGLNQKLNEKDAEIQVLEHQNEILAKRLDDLEQMLKSSAQKN